MWRFGNTVNSDIAHSGPLPVAKRMGARNTPPYADAMAESARVVPLRRASQPQAPQETPLQEPLWREVLGRRLRALRQDQDETLAETAGRAGISPQYLSEIERGRKEP